MLAIGSGKSLRATRPSRQNGVGDTVTVRVDSWVVLVRTVGKVRYGVGVVDSFSVVGGDDPLVRVPVTVTVQVRVLRGPVHNCVGGESELDSKVDRGSKENEEGDKTGKRLVGELDRDGREEDNCGVGNVDSDAVDEGKEDENCAEEHSGMKYPGMLLGSEPQQVENTAAAAAVTSLQATISGTASYCSCACKPTV